jgi:quercetin dioxygenase-like cupin family protein
MGGVSVPVVRAEGEGEVLRGVGGVRYLVRLSGADTAGELAVVECELAPGSIGAAAHVHRRHAEHFHVITGEVTFETPDGDVVAGPDTWVSVPRDVAHGFRNDGAVAALLRCTVTPAGYEDYFRAIDRALSLGEELAPDDLARLRSAYSTDTLDPES